MDVEGIRRYRTWMRRLREDVGRGWRWKEEEGRASVSCACIELHGGEEGKDKGGNGICGKQTAEGWPTSTPIDQCGKGGRMSASENRRNQDVETDTTWYESAKFGRQPAEVDATGSTATRSVASGVDKHDRGLRTRSCRTDGGGDYEGEWSGGHSPALAQALLRSGTFARDGEWEPKWQFRAHLCSQFEGRS